MDIDQIITRSAREVAEQYVFPEIGDQLSELLAKRLAEGRYRDAATPEALGAEVTADLQSINGDKHLRLKFHSEPIPALEDREQLFHAMVAREAAATMDGVRRVERLDGNIALLEFEPLLFDTQTSGGTIATALQLVAKAEALVIDLRRVRGGTPHTVALICSYLFDGEPVHLIDTYERRDDRVQQFWTLPHVPGPRFGGTKPIRVLTSAETFSGGEELAYDLQYLGRATVVGERTGGGAHPRVGVRMHPHLELTVPVARAMNPVTGENWEGVGVVPDIKTPADQALEAALATLEPEAAEAA
jgi:C-terminal processing protease CtpA/Prc